MLRVLALVIPLALAGAVSPVMLSEQTVLLSGPDGHRAARRYAIGVVGTVSVVVTALVVFGHSISLPRDPLLNATLDVVLGALLLTLAAVLQWRRPRKAKRKAPTRGAMSPDAALAFGVVSMATNVTTLALLVTAAREISASSLELVGRIFVCALVVVLVSLPAWLPLALVRIAPGPAARGLQTVSSGITRRGRLLTVLLLVVLGAFLVGRGTVHLVAESNAAAAPVAPAGAAAHYGPPGVQL